MCLILYVNGGGHLKFNNHHTHFLFSCFDCQLVATFSSNSLVCAPLIELFNEVYMDELGQFVQTCNLLLSIIWMNWIELETGMRCIEVVCVCVCVCVLFVNGLRFHITVMCVCDTRLHQFCCAYSLMRDYNHSITQHYLSSRLYGLVSPWLVFKRMCMATATLMVMMLLLCVTFVKRAREWVERLKL